ncbi:Microprocessor complex subunit DGCR8 [Oopsacas minuta]|uniref:Microprocessor complex subunit DGCR8 n=1 Tax=Oopsacas minuta TaxID=111878 RepID=A0AAV7JZ48_9METZ|nr:Microprocessor complex subunit DGCR8 [Oopsacas minuta]
MEQDPFKDLMPPQMGQLLPEGAYKIPTPHRQLDLPTSSQYSHTLDTYNMFSEPMDLTTDYGLDFPFENEADSFSQFDSSFLPSDSSFLNSEASSLYHPRRSFNNPDFLQSFSDNETKGEININTSSYITPEEIDKFEKSFPMPGVKSELQDFLRPEDQFGGPISDDSDVEEGEIVDKSCPVQQSTKQLIVKCTDGTKEPMQLPNGWVQVWHKSGIPVYLHVETRTVTVSRPYFLPYIRNIRTHFIPVDSVPCMKEWMYGKKNGSAVLEQKCGIKDAKDFQTLSADKVNVYLRELWDFEEKVVQNYQKEQGVKKRVVNNPNMVEIEIPQEFKVDNKHRDFWRVNMTGKTPVALVDEYSRFFLKSKAEFTFREVTDHKNPFICTVILKGINYASENGTSKKLAKQKACEATIKLVCPQLYERFQQFQNKQTADYDTNLKELYNMSIDDESAMEKLNKAGLPRPFQILKQCIERKSLIAEKPEFEIKEKDNKTFHMSLVIGKYKASVDCTNKREGKNIISQKILKQMYPSLTLGSLIELHTNIALMKDKVDMPTNAEFREMTMGLQNKPKTKILEILKAEMLKLSDRIEQGKPISDKFAKLMP